MPERSDHRERRALLFAPALYGGTLLHAIDLRSSLSPIMFESSREDGMRVTRICIYSRGCSELRLFVSSPSPRFATIAGLFSILFLDEPR